MANNPTLLKMPLATDGEKAAIPETTGSTTGKFSQQYGFQAINALPLQAGGVAPKREDMNGVFNLLGGVAFYAQKGWVFEYDSTQAYYKGCIVIDTADGNKYECIADMAAGTIAPHSDTSNTYWKDANFLIKQITPAYNKRDEINTSGTYTAPVTGWYKITLKGGGAGGQGAGKNGSLYAGGIGGGEGAIEIAYAYMTQGSTVSVTIGAGGSGGNYSTSAAGASGGDGGNTVVTLSGGVTYTASGAIHGGPGATGLIPGGASSPRIFFTSTVPGGTGGGAGGGTGTVTANYVSGLAGTKGGGGAGGGYEGSGSHYQKGGAGGNGYVWFEYWED